MDYVFKETNDKQKYDKARKIPIIQIEAQYKKDWDSETIKNRQRGVIIYIIDKVSFIWAKVGSFKN